MSRIKKSECVGRFIGVFKASARRNRASGISTPTLILLIFLERVKGIEPSYSAWKAAALPLSYTRVRPINYHAAPAASTTLDHPWPSSGLDRALTGGDFLPILGSPLTTKGGDPVSYTKRCHLAGIAR